jgi:c-di-GMP-binding flagellar brake protein YcgR
MTMRRPRGAERRRFVRVAEELVVSCTPQPNAEDAFDGTTLNFSAGGILLVSPTTIPVGHAVDLVLRVPGHENDLRLDARVIRVRSLSDVRHEIAIEFTGGDPVSQRELQQVLEDRTGALGGEHDPHDPIPA